MIVEVRTYRVKPGRRAEFLDIFQTCSMPIHERIGMQIVGPLLDLENSDVLSSFARSRHLKSGTA